MKQQTVVTHRYTILQETEKTWPALGRPTLSHSTFLGKYKNKEFFVVITFYLKVFVTQLSINTGISV